MRRRCGHYSSESPSHCQKNTMLGAFSLLRQRFISDTSSDKLQKLSEVKCMVNLSIAGSLIIVAVLVPVCVVLWTRLVKLSARLSAKEFELDSIRDEYDRLVAKHHILVSQLQDEIGRRSAAETRATRIEELESHIQGLNEEWRASRDQIVELTAKREAESRHSEEKLALLTEARTQLGVQFENVANKILDEKTKKFTEQNKLNLESLLSPLGTQINEFKQRVNEVYEKESKERFSLGAEIEKLRSLNVKMDQV